MHYWSCVEFGPSQIGLPGISETAIDFTATTMGQLRMCGRVGDYSTLDRTGLMDVPFNRKCHGPLFTMQLYNEYCYSIADVTMPSNVTITLAADAASVNRGVLYLRGQDELPVCNSLTADGIFIPYGYYLEAAQTNIDLSMQNQNCEFDSKSPEVSLYGTSDGASVCYSTEALYYSQTAYFTSILTCQYATLFLAKTRVLSIVQQGVANRAQYYALAIETIIAVIICYVPFMWTGFNTRPIVHWHFSVPAFPFAVLMFVFDEVRKFYLRQGSPYMSKLTGSKFTKFGKFVHDKTLY